MRNWILFAAAVFVSLALSAPPSPQPTPQAGVDTVRVSRATLSLALDSVSFCRPSQSRGVWPDPPRVLQASRVRILPNGMAGMLDIQEGKLILWSRDGRELAVLGGKGSGPGEFNQRPAIIPWPGDTIAVGDGSVARISLWTAAGHARAISTAAHPRIAASAPLGAMRDGTILFAPSVGLPQVDRSGPTQLRNSYYTWREGGLDPSKFRDSVPVAEFYVVFVNGLRNQIEVNFGRRTWMAVLANGMAVYNNHGTMIELLDARGVTKRVIDLGLADVRVTQAERDSVARARSTVLQRAPQFAEAIRYFPEFRAASRSFEPDADGGLWVGVSPRNSGTGAVYIRLTQEGIADRCFRTDGDERVLGVSRDVVAISTSEPEADVIQLHKTVPLPAR